MEEILDIPLSSSPYIYFNKNPAIQDLLDNFKTLKKEFMQMAVYKKLTRNVDKLDLNSQTGGSNKSNQYGTMYTGSYKSIQLFMRDTLLDHIEKENDNWTPDEKVRIKLELKPYAPYHFQYILKYINIIGAVNYNISYPGSRLRHHFGLDQDYIRLHLCIIESKECIFDIENHKQPWREGEIFGFDDYYVLHGTNHAITSNTPRSILMIDMKKTYLQEYARNWPKRNKRMSKEIFLKINPLIGWDS